MQPLIIMEGAELTGKSFILSELYAVLEPRYRTEKHILNGCHWFNCDVGLFGTPQGRICVEHFTTFAEKIPERTLLFEKFHVSDQVYHQIYQNKKIEYTEIEKRLLARAACIILCTIDEDEQLVHQRLQDRLKLYPHYAAIAQTPAAYLAQQRVYRERIAHSVLPTLILNTTILPQPKLIEQTLTWIDTYAKSN